MSSSLSSHNHWLPQIYFWEVQRRNLTERVKTLFLAENSVKLKNLTGYTAYMVSVAAFNAAGDGPRSTPTRGQTQQAGREKSLGEVSVWGQTGAHTWCWGYVMQQGDWVQIPRPHFRMPCGKRAPPAEKALCVQKKEKEKKKETLTGNLEEVPRSHLACSAHLVSAFGTAATPRLCSLPPPSFCLLAHPTPLYCHCLLSSVSPHFLLHDGDETMIKKTKQNKTGNLCPGEDHGRRHKQAQMSWLGGGGELRGAGCSAL